MTMAFVALWTATSWHARYHWPCFSPADKSVGATPGRTTSGKVHVVTNDQEHTQHAPCSDEFLDVGRHAKLSRVFGKNPPQMINDKIKMRPLVMQVGIVVAFRLRKLHGSQKVVEYGAGGLMVRRVSNMNPRRQSRRTSSRKSKLNSKKKRTANYEKAVRGTHGQ